LTRSLEAIDSPHAMLDSFLYMETAVGA